ncbi:hypothetical protein [Hymenobacter lapidiphilus]|uniref:Uncharacterized protein n=1 Tax=Hymenobacter lapidiphilus TaxID=2608003 RepID=A0A7Y7PL06_9BACT|nr:hypothetical protein [Hymenobacter lapidiphilus]NVO29677.1 hypothetical protein [Hymenobacter lapidiphilus]
MTPTYQIPGFPLTFKRVLRLTHVDGVFDGQPIVWYADYDEDLGRERGIAIVVQGGKKVLYCDAFNNKAFAQIWLYASKGYLYKQRKKAAEALKNDAPLEIYMASFTDPGSAKSIAADIINTLGPKLSWNSLYKQKQLLSIGTQ